MRTAKTLTLVVEAAQVEGIRYGNNEGLRVVADEVRAHQRFQARWRNATMRLKPVQYDSELGRKFAEEYGGLVIGRRRSSTMPVEQPEPEEQYEPPDVLGPVDAQQQHDAAMAARRARQAQEKG